MGQVSGMVVQVEERLALFNIRLDAAKAVLNFCHGRTQTTGTVEQKALDKALKTLSGLMNPFCLPEAEK